MENQRDSLSIKRTMSLVDFSTLVLRLKYAPMLLEFNFICEPHNQELILRYKKKGTNLIHHLTLFWELLDWFLAYANKQQPVSQTPLIFSPDSSSRWVGDNLESDIWKTERQTLHAWKLDRVLFLPLYSIWDTCIMVWLQSQTANQEPEVWKIPIPVFSS